MKAAYDAGINFFDCAEAYAGGKSEIVMGEAIKKFGWKRNDIVISTKVRQIFPAIAELYIDIDPQIDILGICLWRERSQ